MTYHTPKDLTGMRTFVVEKDPMVALDVALSLQDAGAEVFGPYPNCDAALAALDMVGDDAAINVAVLDVTLGQVASDPVARAFHDLGVPIVFHTSVGSRSQCQSGTINAPVIQKTSSTERLIEGVMQCVTATARTTSRAA